MTQKEYPKFIFISGIPRSGEVALLRSFDYHPEVLVWPVEFFYFEFFKKIAASTNKITVHKLNTALEEILTRQLSNEIQRESKELAKFFRNLEFPANKNINVGGFDYQLFIQNLRLKEDEEINALEYLRYIFDCLKQANSFYKKKKLSTICYVQQQGE